MVGAGGHGWPMKQRTLTSVAFSPLSLSLANSGNTFYIRRGGGKECNDMQDLCITKE